MKLAQMCWSRVQNMKNVMGHLLIIQNLGDLEEIVN